jgi:polyhydroxyalkanoate synthesis regulator protein
VTGVRATPWTNPDSQCLLKRYAGHRLYRPATGTYLTRGDLMTMAENGEKFVVIDAGTGNDFTSLYQPIIVEH